MRHKIAFIVKLLLLVVVLNVVRYVVAGPIEALLIFDRLFGAMDASRSFFNTQFTRWDWITSYFYNFIMWLVAEIVFIIMEPVLIGGAIVKSLKAFGLMNLAFLSISAIYMNHYSHPKTFYLYNMLDSLIAFAVVALANGLIYPLMFKRRKT